MATWWDDLGDDELFARLVQRGVVDVAARSLVDHREACRPCRAFIDRTLS